MRELVPGLLATDPQPLSFAPELEVRSYLLRRDEGNLLLYGATTLAGEGPSIEGAGGAIGHYLNHWHEAMFGSGEVQAPLLVHAADAAQVEKRTGVDGTFTTRSTLGDDFELIPTPGHTPGATAYLWRHNGHRYLFTGDTLYLSDGEWVAGVLDSSDRAAYVASLELIRELDFDVLVPWAASRDQPPMGATDPDDRRRRLDEVIGRVSRGEDG